jgi:hypothetical protein
VNELIKKKINLSPDDRCGDGGVRKSAGNSSSLTPLIPTTIHFSLARTILKALFINK